MIVASRYHNLVAAVTVGRPVISLGYGPKGDALLKSLGVSDRSHDVEGFDVTEVLEQVEAAQRLRLPLFSAARESFRQEIGQAIEQVMNGGAHDAC